MVRLGKAIPGTGRNPGKGSEEGGSMGGWRNAGPSMWADRRYKMVVTGGGEAKGQARAGTGGHVWI